mmetsp:Transcript_3483/g.5780  ORF Transcript_3483/g.5780 Transcript_3483/m.5780 type:complete len:473 (+) Transcript_3483:74-1492(+)
MAAAPKDDTRQLSPNTRQEGARAALLTLAAINVLNYADRYVPSAIKTLLQAELQLSDAETTYPTAAMLTVYMVMALVYGVIVDWKILDRRVLLALAVALWSLATALTSTATSLMQLIIYRSLLGVGEAAYASIVPPILADFYPRAERNNAYAIFNAAMPLGAATGFVTAAIVASVFGWRSAFLVCGIPGLLLALLILRLHDPPRGINDKDMVDILGPSAEEGNVRYDGCEPASLAGPPPSFFATCQGILCNSWYAAATAGMIAQTFAIGAFAEWFPTLMVRDGTASTTQAGMVLGAAIAIGGLFGSLLGAKVAQYFEGTFKSAYFLVSATFAVPAAVCAVTAVATVRTMFLAVPSIILGLTCAFAAIPPLNAVSISVIPVHLRARSSGLQVFLMHALGDVLSPPIVGLISDSTGSLSFALQVASLGFWLSALCWWLGCVLLPPLPPFSHEDARRGQVMDLFEADDASVVDRK